MGTNLIFDFDGAGVSNISVSLIRELKEVADPCFPKLMHKLFMLNAGWTIEKFWGVVSIFMP